MGKVRTSEGEQTINEAETTKQDLMRQIEMKLYSITSDFGLDSANTTQALNDEALQELYRKFDEIR